jgi:hypothetical protein
VVSDLLISGRRMAFLIGYLVRQVYKATLHGMSEITTGSSHRDHMACLVGYLVRQVYKATPYGMYEITTGSSHPRLPF